MGIRDLLNRLHRFWIDGFNYTESANELDSFDQNSTPVLDDDDETNEENVSKTNRLGKEKDVRTKQKPANDKAEFQNPERALITQKEPLWRIYTQDMLQFIKIPYDMSGPIFNSIDASGNPYAYILLYNNPFNIEIAWKHINFLNKLILESKNKLKSFSNDFLIKKEEIKSYALICTPYTSKGEIAHIPISLKFVSPSAANNYEIDGYIHYKPNGKMQDANVRICRKKVTLEQYDPFNPFQNEFGYTEHTLIWEFIFTSFTGNITLWRAEQKQDGSVINEYKHDALLERDRCKERDFHYYGLLKVILPNDCPKSFALYRRMRLLKTKQYYMIVDKLKMEYGQTNLDSDCKQVYGLLMPPSHNPKYPPRPMTDDVRCQERVLGVCDESYFKQ